MSTIASLDILLRGNTSGIDKSLSATNKSLDKFQQGVSQKSSALSKSFLGLSGLASLLPGNFANLTSQVGSISSSFATTTVSAGLLGKALAGIAGAAAAATAALLGLGLTQLPDIARIKRMAEQFGISTEALAGLEYAAQRSGLSVEEFDGALVKMQRSIAEGATGSQEAAQAFHRLREEVEKSLNIKPPEKVQNALESMFGNTQKANTALLHLSDGLEDARKSASPAGAALFTLGIEMEHLQGLKPAEQVKALVGALNKVPDAAQKAKLSTSLFGTTDIKAPKIDLPKLTSPDLKITPQVDGKAALSALQQLKLDPHDLVNMTLKDQVDTLADAFKQVKNETIRTDLILKIFGRGAAALDPLLRQGSAGLQKFREEADALGLTFTKLEAEQAAKAAGAVAKIKYAFTGLGRQSAIGFAPIIEDLAKPVSSFIATLTSGVQEVMPIIKELWNLVKSFFYFIADFAIIQPFKLLGDYLGVDFKSIFSDVRSFIVDIMVALEFAFTHWKELAIVAFNTVAKAFYQFLDKLNEIGREFGAPLPDYKDTIKQLDKLLAQQKEFLSLGLGNFLNQRRKELFPERKEENKPKAAGEIPRPEPLKVAEKGSKEAFSIIYGTQRDRMYELANLQLKEDQMIRKLLEKYLDKTYGIRAKKL
jgi:hypothetical protein